MSESLTSIVFIAWVVAVAGALYYLMPRLTRPDMYFAVTVPADFRDAAEGRRILRRYCLEVLAHSVIALGLVLAGALVNPTWLPLGGIFWQGIGSFSAYYRARRRVMPHAAAPTNIREAELKPRETRLPGGRIPQLGPFAVLMAAAVYLHLHWAQIPDRFPVHWGIDSRPNRWTTRSLSSVYGSLLAGAATCLGLLLLAYATAHWSRRIRVSGAPGESEVHFRRTVLSVLLAAEYFVALVFAWTELRQLASNQQGPPGISAVLLLSLIFVGAVSYILVRIGQGRSRLAAARRTALDLGGMHPVGDRTLDRYWKAGVLYFNREDPAIIVEKRFGIGYTMNFGHSASWVIIGLLLLVPLALALWSAR